MTSSMQKKGHRNHYHRLRCVPKVTETKILDYRDSSAYDFSREDENLILYTCYPFDAMGFTPDRFFVYARYISGPVLDRNS